MLLLLLLGMILVLLSGAVNNYVRFLGRSVIAGTLAFMLLLTQSLPF